MLVKVGGWCGDRCRCEKQMQRQA